MEQFTEKKKHKLMQGNFTNHCHTQLTKIVQPVGVGSILVPLLHKLEVMRSLVGNHARVLPATMDNVPEALPRVFLHKELRRDVLHLHHLRAVRKAVHSRHANSHTAGCQH